MNSHPHVCTMACSQPHMYVNEFSPSCVHYDKVINTHVCGMKKLKYFICYNNQNITATTKDLRDTKN